MEGWKDGVFVPEGPSDTGPALLGLGIGLETEIRPGWGLSDFVDK